MVYSVMVLCKPTSCSHPFKVLDTKAHRNERIALISEVVAALLLIAVGSLAVMAQAGMNLGPLNVLGQIPTLVAVGLQAAGAAWILFNMVMHSVKNCKTTEDLNSDVKPVALPPLTSSDPLANMGGTRIERSDRSQISAPPPDPQVPPKPAPFSPPPAGEIPPAPPSLPAGVLPGKQIHRQAPLPTSSSAAAAEEPKTITPPKKPVVPGMDPEALKKAVSSGLQPKKEKTEEEIVNEALIFRCSKSEVYDLAKFNFEKLKKHHKELVAAGVMMNLASALETLQQKQADPSLKIDTQVAVAGSIGFIKSVYEKLGKEKFAELFS